MERMRRIEFLLDTEFATDCFDEEYKNNFIKNYKLTEMMYVHKANKYVPCHDNLNKSIATATQVMISEKEYDKYDVYEKGDKQTDVKLHELYEKLYIAVYDENLIACRVASAPSEVMPERGYDVIVAPHFSRFVKVYEIFEAKLIETGKSLTPSHDSDIS